MIDATKISGEQLWSVGAGRYIGVDRSASDDIHTECEVQMNADGSITVLDIREFPINLTTERD